MPMLHERSILNKQIQRIDVPGHFMFAFEYINYHETTFAEQKTEKKLKNLIQSISISSGHNICIHSCFIKNCIKTVGAFALKGTTYIETLIRY